MSRTLISRGMPALSGRFLLSRKIRSLLTALGVAFGVALIAALTILGGTLQASITDQLREGFGTYDVMAGYHEGRFVQPAERTKMERTRGVRYGVGVLYLSPNRPETEGVDMAYNYLAVGEFPRGEFAYPLREGRYPGPAEFVTDPRMATMLRMKVGDSIELPFQTGTQKVTLVGISRPAGKGGSDSLWFNLSWLQQQMKLGDQVTIVLLGLQSGANKDLVDANLRMDLPDLDIQLRKELDEVKENMGGLKPMAIAFGTAGLFAAIFLVGGSFGIALQERARELALLRAVGAGQRQVMRLILREAVVLGLAGGVVGVGLGALAAWAALSATTASIGVRPHALVLPWLPLLLECAGGVLLALIAAWRPARAAGAVPPLQAMRPDTPAAEARQEKRAGRGALVLMAVSAAVVVGAGFMKQGEVPRVLTGALGGLTFVAALIAALPRILPGVVRMLSVPLGALLLTEATIAGRSVLRHRKRSALTAATLVLGVMLITSMGTLLQQMARNGEVWTRTQFPTDATVSVSFTREANLGTGLPAKIGSISGVTGVFAAAREHYGYIDNYDPTRADAKWIATHSGQDEFGNDRRAFTTLVPIDLTQMAKAFDPGRVQGTLSGQGVVITEKQAKARGLNLGGTLHFREDLMRIINGQPQYLAPIDLPIVAVVERLPLYDEQFAVTRSLLGADPDSRVFFNFDRDRREQVLDQVQNLLADPAYRRGRLNDLTAALEADRQGLQQRMGILWAVTVVIFLIAAFGLFNAMVTSLQQRRREMATLRAVGATPGQIIRQVILEGVLTGLAGTALGLVAGLAFSGSIWVALYDGSSFSLLTGLPLYLAALVVGPVLALAASLPPAVQSTRGRVGRSLAAD